jgi:hypothetical protein
VGIGTASPSKTQRSTSRLASGNGMAKAESRKRHTVSAASRNRDDNERFAIRTTKLLTHWPGRPKDCRDKTPANG